MAPVDAIWLFLVKTAFAHQFVGACLPSHPIGMLVILAMPVETI